MKKPLICALATLLALPLAAAADAARAQDVPEDGVSLYLEHCANCHGVFGEGDGIVTPSLAVVLQDLRYLAARNQGQFPRQFIVDIIDGRAMRAAHGPEGMPVWGIELARHDPEATDIELRVIRRIDALVDFLESIQIVDRNE
jgi:mono/diheme cytochrome c family protein